MAPPGYGQAVGQPMMGAVPAAMMMQAAAPPPMPGGMQTLAVTAMVPGGQPMIVNGPGGPVTVQVPAGILPGQQFYTQVAAPAQPMAVPMAVPMAGEPPVVMA